MERNNPCVLRTNYRPSSRKLNAVRKLTRKSNRLCESPMPHEIELLVLLLDANTLHLRDPAGHYLALPRHRIAPDLLTALEQSLHEPPDPHAHDATPFRQTVMLHVQIEDGDDRWPPQIIEIVGIAGPAAGT